MTLSLKDLTKYSSFLSIGFWTIALLGQPIEAMHMEFLNSLKQHGNTGIFCTFLLAFAFAFLTVGSAQVWRYLDHVYCRDWLIPCMAALFFAFGLTVFCKLEGSDPFPSLNQFWRLGCLAYGALLVDIAVMSDKASRPERSEES